MSASGIRLIQLADIGIGEFLNRSERYVSKETFERIGCTELLPEDILISRMADPAGRACIIPDLNTKLITAVDCSIVRLNQEKHNNKYWVYVFNSPTWFAEIQRYSSGSTRNRISRKNLESILAPVPSKIEQDLLVNKLEAITKTISATNEHLQNLSQLRKQILSQSFG